VGTGYKIIKNKVVKKMKWSSCNWLKKRRARVVMEWISGDWM
jgi:hypothetical protein